MKKEIDKVKAFYDKQMVKFWKRLEFLRGIGVDESDSDGDVGSRDGSFHQDEKELRSFLFHRGDDNKDLEELYIKLYTGIESLKSFIEINQHAFSDLVEGYVKFSGQVFSNERLLCEPFGGDVDGLENLVEEMRSDYANLFTHVDLLEAAEQLKSRNKKSTEGDVFVLFFLVGICVSMVFSMLWVSVDGGRVGDFWLVFPIFRGTLLINMYFYLYGCCVYFWTKSKINHMYLLELNPKNIALDSNRSWKVASMLFVCWTTCFFLYLSLSKAYLPVITVLGLRLTADYFPLFCFLFFCLFFFFPFHTFHLSSRITLFKTLFHCAITPFGYSRFRENFAADVVSSMVISLEDIGYASCYFLTGSWITATGDRQKCSQWNKILTPTFAIIPYLWRFLQSARQVLKGKQWIQILNAGKYFSAITQVVLNGVHLNFDVSSWGAWKIVWIAAIFVAMTYCFIWDSVMDWGLISFHRHHKQKTLFGCIPLYAPKIRQRRMFPDWYYIISVVLNFFGRFAWIGTLSYNFIYPEYKDILKIGFGFLELCRRANWSIIRLEWAQISNYLKYRKSVFVPNF